VRKIVDYMEYLMKNNIVETKLISEDKIESTLRSWCKKIAEVLGIMFQGKWDTTGMTNIFKNDILQFTDITYTKTTFTVDYSKDMNFTELMDKVKDKLHMKRKQFEEI